MKPLRPTTRQLLPVVAALALAAAPHAPRLPLWITAWCGAMWGYRLLSPLFGWRLPGPVARAALTTAGFLAGLVTYRFAFTLDAGVGLLSLMMGLKPFELRSRRDHVTMVFLIYFMVVTNLFYASSLGIAVYMVFAVFFTTAVWIQINHPGSRFGPNLRVSARIVLPSLPLALLLFFIFPRSPGGLWGNPAGAAVSSGFSGRLSAGSLSTLALDRAVAFRAAFHGPVPPPSRLYWRGLVFQHFSGGDWYRGVPAPRRPTPFGGNSPVDYTVTLEPHGEKWLFTLDLPGRGRVPGMFRSDHTLSALRRVRHRIRYRVTSFGAVPPQPLHPWEASTRMLPAGVNPESVALAETWRDRHGDAERIVAAALRFFRENGFRYTLDPPPGKGSIDAFLFDTRRGYCEHYASAFAFLMRAAGLPARVVGGYLGGEWNPVGGYLIVRNADAHAWVEVWLSGKGWTRVDPTSVVAPARVQRGVAAALAPEERQKWEGFSWLGPLGNHLKRVAFGWDAVENQWNRWVMGYSHLQQQAVFSRFGLRPGSSWGPLAATLTAVAALVLWGGLRLRGRRRPAAPAKRDVVQRTWLRFCDRLAAIGVVRPPARGPVHFARQAAAARPDLAEAVRRITRLYVLLRYAESPRPGLLEAFRADVKRFRPLRAAAPVRARTGVRGDAQGP